MPLILQPYQAQASPQMASQPRGQAVARTDYTGGALVDLGGVLQKAQERIQTRADTIERARDYGAFFESATQELTKRSTEQDFSRPESVKDYAGFLNETMSKYIKEHRGSEDSKAELFTRLESQRLNLVNQAASMSNSAQRKQVVTFLDRHQSALSAKAFENPGGLIAHFREFDNALREMALGMTLEEEMDYRDKGRSELTRMAVESLLVGGDIGAAEETMKLPGVAETMDSEVQKRIFISISQAKSDIRKAQTKGLTEGANEIQKFRAIMGREPNEQERSIIAGTTSKDGGGGVGGPFGTNKNLNIIHKFGHLYEQDMLDPQQKAMVEIAVQDYKNKQYSYTDPITKQTIVRNQELPPQFRGLERAIAQGGAPRQQGGATGQPAGQAGGDTSLTPNFEVKGDPAKFRQELMTTTNLDPDEKKSALEAFDAQYGTPEQKQSYNERKGIWGLAADLAGPVPRVAAIMGKSPIVGPALAGDFVNRAIQSKQFAQTAQTGLVNSLRTSKNFPDKERQELNKQFSVLSSLWDNVPAFKQSLIGIADGLNAKLQAERKTADDSTLPPEMRKDSMENARAIEDFMKVLNMPIRVKSPDEVSKLIGEGKLKPGDEFITPDGKIMRVKKK